MDGVKLETKINEALRGTMAAQTARARHVEIRKRSQKTVQTVRTLQRRNARRAKVYKSRDWQ